MESMMRSIRLARRVRPISLFVMAALIFGSSVSGASATSSTSDVRLYFLVNGKISATDRGIPSVPTVSTETLAALFAGPKVNELAIGQRSELPVGLTLDGPLTIDAKTKIATVRLPSIVTSDAAAVEAQRMAQIVFTLTQFSTITSVNFVIDGTAYKPFTADGKRAAGAVMRADYEAVSPVILIESADGKNPLHVTGTANVFEAEFRYELYDAGNASIAKGAVLASSGTGTRGTFSTDIPYSVKAAQTGVLIVFEQSAKDGSTINLSAVQVALRPK